MRGAQGGQEGKSGREGREEGQVSFKQRGVAYKTVNESTAGWSSPGLRLNNVEARERAWRGPWRRGEESGFRLLFLPIFLPLPLFLFFNPPLFVHLSFWLLFRSFIAAMGEKEDDCASLKVKVGGKTEQWRKEGRGEANHAQDNLMLSHGPTHDGVRATLFANGRGTRLRIRFLCRDSPRTI